MKVSSYIKLMAITHGFARWATQAEGPLVYQEKVDGSQIGFRLEPGAALPDIRSKRAEARGNGMFDLACEVIDALELHPGWTYRGEYLQKPKHNAITYGRVHRHHIVLFDIDRGECDYLSPDELRAEGARLGLEVVPTWVHAGDPDPEWLKRESFLGGAIVEGWVAKDYTRLDRRGKTAMVKCVRDDFREVNKANWKKQNPSRMARFDEIAARYATEARWQKGVQHLAEDGQLEQSPRDIGPLMREVSRDIEEECAEEVKEALYAAFRKELLRTATRGLAEWYKRQLPQGAA